MARRPDTCRSICASSSPAPLLYGLGVAFLQARRSCRRPSSPATSFGASCRSSFRPFSSVLLTQWLGLYVASFLLVAGFMRFVGRIALWKSLLTSFLFAVIMFATFEIAFDVIMPKGPIEALFGF